MVVSQAGIPLGSLLAAPQLRLTLVAGPDEPGRVLRWAHCTDLLSPARYLRGGELVLTSGSALTSAECCETFIQELVRSHAQAVGLGIGDIHDDAPAALRDACDRHGLPLLSVPYGVPFQALTELFAEHRVVERLAGVRRTGAIVATALDAMARPGAAVDILALVAEELGGLLLIVDDRDVVETRAGRHADPGLGPTHAVDLAGQPPARLVWHPVDDVPAPVAMEMLRELAHALTLWRHELSKTSLRAARDLGGLLELVLDGMAEPRAVLRSLGIAEETELLASAWPLGDASRLSTLPPDAPRAVIGDVIVVLLREPGPAHELASARGIPCGTGQLVRGLELPGSVREALAALALSRRRGRPVASNELATLDALLDRLPADALSPLVDQLLLPLVEHDRRTGSALVESLRAFLEGTGVVPTARVLFVHPNTLRHRLTRVTDISGRDPLVWSDRVCFALAFLVWDRRPGTRQRISSRATHRALDP